MWANTCWGFLSLSVAFALARLAMIWTTGHEEWGPILIWAAAVCGLLSIICFLWPILSRHEGFAIREKKIPMRQAATMAYEQLRSCKSIWADVADRFSGSTLGKTKEEGVLLYMSNALTTQGVPVYGKHPPSQQHETIDPMEFNRGRFEDGGNVFCYHNDKSPKYVDLAVQAHDLKNAIAHMKRDASKAI